MQESITDGQTSLDTLETTAIPPLPHDYAEYLRRSNPEEYYATIDALIAYHGSSTAPQIERLAKCRQHAWFAANIHTGDIRVMSNACRSRWCYHCSRARAGRIAVSTRAWTSGIARPKLLTLTLKHTSAPLAMQLDALYRFFRKLRSRRKFSRLVHGGIWFCQVTKTADEEWHPHLHCVLDAEYVPHPMIKALWEQITHGSTIVDIRTVTSPEKAANYVARYVARPANLADYETDDALEIIEAFEGRRLVGCWGTAREADLTGKATFEKSDWRYLGSWTSITAECYSQGWQQVIVHHWMRGEPVNVDWLQLITDTGDTIDESTDVEPEPPPQQLDLFEHAPRYRG